MQLRRFTDIDEFAACVELYLFAHEATHCLMLGLLSTLPRVPQSGDEIPYMAVVVEQANVVVVAMRTPPFNVILSRISPDYGDAAAEAMDLLSRDLWPRYGGQLRGVNAPVPVSQIFAERWQQMTGQTARLTLHERVYELESVIPVAGVQGTFRRVTEADRDLMVRWLVEFAAEALGPLERLAAADWVDHFYTTPSRGGYFWEDGGRPVSLVAYGNPTPHGVRIGPVYTPPEHRGHGYASACVAVLSQHLLDSGRTFCFLFTDLANPTSNHIYQTVGYNPVNDVDIYEFEMEK
ncbi:MAG TPA: GNAT family N-acetyltransferase [Ktedonobacterales bacterium]|nr:GNAT family N-acetyltransferase [Ktedonobacterales bacterium]